MRLQRGISPEVHSITGGRWVVGPCLSARATEADPNAIHIAGRRSEGGSGES